ncbi:RNA polymerase sigma factor [Chitinophaga sp. XS-30]|uniref:RNA polymerase sigma factor n=1 Tax=Chitinophaga sp. XS-30 TaxID=2604421 RepID=UPI0011DD69C7|nr:sigma-70 family RNA polymerase sigma factor [Chitinophaga sp. XS-30]QEH41696.1 sigma-70 family RNA polymerase sigma factor [Chitinophaga sp. XS-30]
MTSHQGQFSHTQRQAAFEASVIRYWDKLLGIATAKTNPDDAPDVVQDVFLSLWEKWEEAPKDETLEYYLLHSLKLRIYNYYRTTSRYQAHLKALEHMLQETLEVVFVREDMQALRESFLDEALETLSPSQRQLFLLRTRHQYSYRKIAQLLNIEPASARVLYARALQQVKSYIHANPALAARLMSALILFTIP